MKYRFLILVPMLLALLSCREPCVNLSEKICKCRPTTNEQQACRQRVGSIADSQENSPATTQRCADILDSKLCSCGALAAGRLDLCGLADSANFPPLPEE